MIILWIVILSMQLQANYVMREVTKKNVGSTQSTIAKL